MKDKMILAVAGEDELPKVDPPLDLAADRKARRADLKAGLCALGRRLRSRHRLECEQNEQRAERLGKNSLHSVRHLSKLR